uniref:AP complex mu/sigma subunit domain-containing protein n=1 Tax=Oryza punctata TaxID=4537 RepID=A0A0E0JQT3_ORYPU
MVAGEGGGVGVIWGGVCGGVAALVGAPRASAAPPRTATHPTTGRPPSSPGGPSRRAGMCTRTWWPRAPWAMATSAADADFLLHAVAGCRCSSPSWHHIPPPRRANSNSTSEINFSLIIGAVLIVAGLYLVLWEKSQERAIAAAKEASAAAAAAPRGVAVGGRWRRGGGLGREQVAEEHAVIGSVPEKEKSASLASFLQFSSSVLVLASLTRSLLLPSSIASLAQQSATNPPANRGIAPIPSPILQIRLPEMESCPSVKNILVLDSEGKRVAVKYYSDDWPSLSSKQAFEKSVFAKTQKTSARTEAEIVMFDSYIVVYKFIQDLHFFVTGGDEENELILASVLQGFSEAIDYLLRNKVHRRAALENLDLIFLCLDEVVDGGIVLETDAKAILEKVSGHGEGSGSLTEQKLSSALATAKEHFARSIFS